MPACPDSDKDEPRTVRLPQTPERELHAAMLVPGASPSAPYHASSLLRSPAASSHLITAVSPDAVSNSNNSNEDVVTAQRPAAVSPHLATARHWAAAPRSPSAAADGAAAATSASSKPRVIVRANQADGKIHVEVCLSFKLNTTGTIRVRGEVASALHPRTVSVNGQQIWSDAARY